MEWRVVWGEGLPRANAGDEAGGENAKVVHRASASKGNGASSPLAFQYPGERRGADSWVLVAESWRGLFFGVTEGNADVEMTNKYPTHMALVQLHRKPFLFRYKPMSCSVLGLTLLNSLKVRYDTRITFAQLCVYSFIY